MQLNTVHLHEFVYVLILFILCHCDCASSNDTQSNGETRIVGGEEAKKHEFPFLIRIQRKSSKSLLCGGAIISNDMILTAAHCFFEGDPSELEVVAGDHNAAGNEGFEQIKNIKRVVLHENYNPKTFVNDICLLTLSSNFNLTSPVVKTIPLPPQGYTPPGNSTVAGWGKRLENATVVESILRKVSVIIVPNNLCLEQYREVVPITSQMLCAGSSGKDSCQGDSGGPLICETGNSTYACGIVSFGIGCGQPNFPGVYTRNSEYVDWISGVNNGTKGSITYPTNQGSERLQILPNLVGLIILQWTYFRCISPI